MIWMPMYIHIIFSYLAAVGFAVFLNAPKKTLYISGGIGMISWVIYILLMRINIDDVYYDTIIKMLYTNFTNKIYGQKKMWQKCGKIFKKILKNAI